MPKIVFNQKDFDRLDRADRAVFERAPDIELAVGDPEASKADFQAVFEGDQWKLKALSEDWAPLQIESRSEKSQKRSRDPLRWKDPLVKAFGLTPKTRNLKILDLTAGLGGDAFFLASLELDLEYRAIERSTLLYFFLNEALKIHPIKALKIEHADALKVLQSLSAPIDVLYLDPMFATEKKKALPPREMQYLRRLLGEPFEGESVELLDASLRAPALRIVMKNALKAKAHPQRSFSVEGKSHRFDVFLKPAAKSTAKINS